MPLLEVEPPLLDDPAMPLLEVELEPLAPLLLPELG
jgi:hypothetical protein